MKYRNVFRIVLFFFFITTNFVAQNKSYDLKVIWENTKNADSIRFNALADYYKLNNQAQPDSTLKVLDYYYQLAKEKNNTKELYNVANDRGGIYRLKGELDTSMSYYQEAEKLATKLNDSILKAANLGNIGNVYANKKDYKKALQYFTNSLTIYKKIKDKTGESRMLSSIGNVYLYIQNYDLALAYYQKALTAIKNSDVPPRSIAVIYINIGWTNYELKKYKESIIHYDKALKILEVTNDKFFLVSCYSTLANIYIELNELEKANFYAKKNSFLCNELKIEGYTLDSEIIFAKIAFKEGNIAEARKKGETILAGLDINSGHEIKLSLYDLLYKCYQAENNPEKSLEMFQKYTIYKDSIQLEKNKISLIREVIKNEFDDIVQENKLKNEKEKAELELKQLKKTYGIIIGSLILIGLITLYFNRNLKRNRKKRDELLQEIEKLKNNEVNALVVNPHEFQLVREKIENFIQRKLNDTDWNVLNILLKEPDISNKELAEKAFLSVDGIGSALRRMYIYFDIKESKYKKIALITEAIKISNH
ncbi:tetratricopeptide repeat protein [Flavobacterium lacus]|uniref:Winged helix-turn-helix DNA-binding protein n=1 Tax=Flavobacterium lacus TaxID=1353778 RepID=A0A328X6H3_9FLAO|nr:tetratricopeptide repeat protein [Flavobacterium lacus]RAR50959.1 winged helix-turn-helix DNA-binding protein [Flavobacterium lacus]